MAPEGATVVAIVTQGEVMLSFFWTVSLYGFHTAFQIFQGQPVIL